MALENSLNLVAAQKPKQANPIVTRRQRVIRRIDQQLRLVRAQLSGETQSSENGTRSKASPW